MSKCFGLFYLSVYRFIGRTLTTSVHCIQYQYLQSLLLSTQCATKVKMWRDKITTGDADARIHIQVGSDVRRQANPGLTRSYVNSSLLPVLKLTHQLSMTRWTLPIAYLTWQRNNTNFEQSKLQSLAETIIYAFLEWIFAWIARIIRIW